MLSAVLDAPRTLEFRAGSATLPRMLQGISNIYFGTRRCIKNEHLSQLNTEYARSLNLKIVVSSKR